MQFRLSSQSADRRRRLLNDEGMHSGLAEGASTAPAGKESSSRAASYTEAARLNKQPHIADLVPRSAVGFAIWFVAGLLAITAIEFGYHWALGSGAPVPLILDLHSGESLSTWLSSMMMTAACGGSLLVFSLRRHKTDDYKGRYRIWFWAALVWLVMSVDETAALHEAFQALAIHVSGTSMWADGTLWWLGTWTLVLAIIGGRLLWDSRTSRSALAAFVITAVLWTVAAAIELGWQVTSEVPPVMIQEGAAMLGQLFLLLGIGLFARHVILDAEGLLPRREAKAKKPKMARSKNVRVDAEMKSSGSDLSPHFTSTSSQRSNADEDEDEVEESSHAAYDEDEDDEESAGHRKLSKAERKRLRRLKAQQRRGELD